MRRGGEEERRRGENRSGVKVRSGGERSAAWEMRRRHRACEERK